MFALLFFVGYTENAGKKPATAEILIANPFSHFDVCEMCRKNIQNVQQQESQKNIAIRNIYDLICLNTSMKDDGNDHFSFHAHHSHTIHTYLPFWGAEKFPFLFSRTFEPSHIHTHTFNRYHSHYLLTHFQQIISRKLSFIRQ